MTAPTLKVAVSGADEKPYPEPPASSDDGLSDKEKAVANAPSEAWPFPKERDGERLCHQFHSHDHFPCPVVPGRAFGASERWSH